MPITLGNLVLLDPCTPPSISSEILCIPISKSGSVTNSLMWKFSNSGDFNVKKAYEILLEEANVSANANLRPRIIPEVVWNTMEG